MEDVVGVFEKRVFLIIVFKLLVFVLKNRIWMFIKEDEEEDELVLIKV